MRRLLRWPVPFTTTTNPTTEQVEAIIENKMEHVNEVTGLSYRIDRSREYKNLDYDYWRNGGSRVPLNNQDIVTPLTASVASPPSTIFADDFTDGDITDWNIISGTWSAALFYLSATDTAAVISHPANIDLTSGNLTFTYKQLLVGGGSNGTFLWMTDNATAYPDSDPSSNWYFFSFGDSDPPTLIRLDGGTSTTLGSTPQVYSTGVYYDIQITHSIAGDIVVSINGLPVISATDSTYSSGSQINLFLSNGGSEQNWDDFSLIAEGTVASGDSLKVWDGTTWEEWVGVKVEARNGDFWIDELEGVLYIVRRGMLTPFKLMDFSYRYNSGGRAEIDLVGGINASQSTLAFDNLTGSFPLQGWIRIDDEEMRYSAITPSTLKLSQRGAFNTTAASHVNGSIIVFVPSDIVDATTMLAAADLLTQEDWSSGGMNSGDIPSAQMPVAQKAEEWRRKAVAILTEKRKHAWSVR